MEKRLLVRISGVVCMEKNEGVERVGVRISLVASNIIRNKFFTFLSLQIGEKQAFLIAASASTSINK